MNTLLTQLPALAAAYEAEAEMARRSGNDRLADRLFRMADAADELFLAAVDVDRVVDVLYPMEAV